MVVEIFKINNFKNNFFETKRIDLCREVLTLQKTKNNAYIQMKGNVEIYLFLLQPLRTTSIKPD